MNINNKVKRGNLGDFVDLKHDSAIQVNLMALAAFSVHY